MPHFLIRWIIITLTVMALPYLVSGIYVESFGSALAAAAVLALLNIFVKPLFILFTLPLTILSLGLFLLVINAILFKWVGAIVSGILITSFWDAFLAAIIVSVVSWFTNFSMSRRDGHTQVRFVRNDFRGKDKETISLENRGGDKWE